MSLTPKKFALLSLIFFVVGFLDVHNAILWGIMKPLGAIFFILFLIYYLMEDEMEKYEEECRLKFSAGNKRKPSKKAA